MNQDINGLAAVGGVMIVAGFISYPFISIYLAYSLWFFGGILLTAGMLTLKKQ